MPGSRKLMPKSQRKALQAERARKLADASLPLVRELYAVHLQVLEKRAQLKPKPKKPD
jgi:hypothetical protein